MPFGLGKRLDGQIAEAGEYYRRGVRILLDRDGTAERFLSLFPASPTEHAMPSAREFRETVAEFWFVVVWTAKHLWRREVWHARASGIEGHLRPLLLRMIEWHAWAMHGPDYDTWNDGRFIEEWADPRVLAHLPDALPSYDRASVHRGLIESANLFAWLSQETAEKLGLAYAPEMAQNIRDWISERTPAS